MCLYRLWDSSTADTYLNTVLPCGDSSLWYEKDTRHYVLEEGTFFHRDRHSSIIKQRFGTFESVFFVLAITQNSRPAQGLPQHLQNIPRTVTSY